MTVASDGSFDFRALVAGAVAAGSTPNGVFAARIMWGTMDLLVHGLAPTGPGLSDVDVLTEAFGPLRFVHVRRHDQVAQAVSWARAEQSGYWQQGDVVSAHPTFDADQVDALVRTIGEHDAAWRTWFEAQAVEPVETTYEGLVADPRRTVEHICSEIGVDVPGNWRPTSPHRRQADELNADWVRRYRT